MNDSTQGSQVTVVQKIVLGKLVEGVRKIQEVVSVARSGKKFNIEIIFT